VNAPPPILQKNGCKNCAHRGMQGPVMVCRFNPPTAAPIIGLNVKGEPQIMGWSASFPPVAPDIKCGKHSFVAIYDDVPTQAPAKIRLAN
jgi:hypothetical protein